MNEVTLNSNEDYNINNNNYRISIVHNNNSIHHENRNFNISDCKLLSLKKKKKRL